MYTLTVKGIAGILRSFVRPVQIQAKKNGAPLLSIWKLRFNLNYSHSCNRGTSTIVSLPAAVSTIQGEVSTRRYCQSPLYIVMYTVMYNPDMQDDGVNNFGKLFSGQTSFGITPPEPVNCVAIRGLPIPVAPLVGCVLGDSKNFVLAMN